MTPRVKIMIEQIARMRVLGIKDGMIAVKIGMSQGGLSRILALPEYKDFEQAILSGHVSRIDELLAGKVKDLEAYAEKAVPVALRTLFEACVQRRDLRVAMSAASEILDRDPKATFTKKSRNVGLNDNSPTVSTAFLDGMSTDADKVAAEVAKHSSSTKVV